MVDVTMPQLGETVTEGTITAWLKAPGDWVDEDEALLEVSTDKVDSELPAPASGRLGPLLVAEGDTVPVGTLLARLSVEPAPGKAAQPHDDPRRDPAESSPEAAPPSGSEGSSTPSDGHDPAAAPTPAPGDRYVPDDTDLGSRSPVAGPRSEPPAAAADTIAGHRPPTPGGAFLSPVVRRISVEHGIDPTDVEGTGTDGRVTAADVERVLAARRTHRLRPIDPSDESTPTPLGTETSSRATATPTSASASARSTTPPRARPAEPNRTGAGGTAPGTEVIPFTAIRRTTAANLTRSLATAAHTLVVMEVDYHRIDTVRPDAGLSYLPFVARAVTDALADHPHLNAHVGDDHLVVHEGVHLGVAVDLDFEGLIVPVIHDAHRLRIGPLAAAMAERASAARQGSLTPDDLSGGTFTLTNAGRYGTLFTAPIINRPQAAILSTDGVRIRPVAIPLNEGGHGLGFHPVGNLALSFDHRAVDGAYASSFLDRVRTLLETRDWSAEVEGRR